VWCTEREKVDGGGGGERMGSVNELGERSATQD